MVGSLALAVLGLGPQIRIPPITFALPGIYLSDNGTLFVFDNMRAGSFIAGDRFGKLYKIVPGESMSCSAEWTLTDGWPLEFSKRDDWQLVIAKPVLQPSDLVGSWHGDLSSVLRAKPKAFPFTIEGPGDTRLFGQNLQQVGALWQISLRGAYGESQESVELAETEPNQPGSLEGSFKVNGTKYLLQGTRRNQFARFALFEPEKPGAVGFGMLAWDPTVARIVELQRGKGVPCDRVLLSYSLGARPGRLRKVLLSRTRLLP